MSVKTVLFTCLLLFASTNCTSTGPISLFPPSESSRLISEYTTTSKKGMVAAAHTLASEAGADILKKGGNAIDAAVASSFAISVLRPQSTGIGGGGFLLFYDAKARKTLVFDFRERAPKLASRNMYIDQDGKPIPYRQGSITLPNASVNGHLAVAVPGLVAGLLEVHEKYGTLPLHTIMKPAIDLARNGFVVYKSLAEAITRRASVLKNFAGTRKIFLPKGVPLGVGETLLQKDLAWTLERIAKHGRSGFYAGPVAKRLLSEIKHGGGILRESDLKSYKVLQRNPVEGTYRNHKIVSMPPPSSGGTHIIQMLNMLESFPIDTMSYNDPKRLHIIAEVMRRAFADRAQYLGDPDFVRIPVKGLTSKRYAHELAHTINESRASRSVDVGYGQPEIYESPSTTHLSVVDANGNAVTSTQTINYTFGSGVVAEGTGIVLNNEMDDFSIKPGVPNAYGLVGSEANAIAARKTPLSSMSPTIVFDPQGQVRLVAGSPGGPRIINATLQTIINVIDHEMPLNQAVQAHRIHHQWKPDTLRVEKKSFPDDTLNSLKNMGHRLEMTDQIGDVQAIERLLDQSWRGSSDTRSEGKPVAP